jgi:citrate/tricarballylate utilization protein
MQEKITKEARRVLTICNACRYCEGFCAVFPAMELRRTFTDGDLKYLANLCHNCRDCYYACQYAPPHDFDLNFPKAMAELRLETYKEFAWPNFLSGLFRQNGFAVTLISILCVAVVALLTFISQGSDAVNGVYTGAKSFYNVIPYWAMVVPFVILAGLAILSFWMSISKFWRETDTKSRSLFGFGANMGAAWDVLRLKYLDGGGHGCNFPDDRFSMMRRNLHHFVFYGFALCLVSTTIAAIYDHVLHLPAPYPYLSWPVVMGTIGGLSILIGTTGLLILKFKMDRRPAAGQSFGMDVSFGVLLFLVNLTGLLLLALRGTSAMGTMLIVHIGLVMALFITFPFGKFVHGVYRYIALVRNARERSEL